ncbi:MAG TPA: FG-GAP repeat protein, partial [Myxococcota bacterium]
MAETVTTSSPDAWQNEKARWLLTPPPLSDPRWPFAALLTLYGVLGFTVFGFNRSPWQMLFIVVVGSVLDMVFARFVRGRAVFPLSAWISMCALAILLNYSHGSLLPFFPVLLCLAGKNILTFEGRHIYNPSMFAVATSLLIGSEMITASPAYQWDGNALTVSFFIAAMAMAMFIFRVGRTWLIVSFLFFYALQTALRAYIMRHHLPPEMLFIGTMTTPPFFLFVMYMITDPGTSPKDPKQQVLIAFLIASVDLVLHLKESVFTFFYAALTVATGKFILVHVGFIRRRGFSAWVRDEVFTAMRGRAVIITGLFAGLYALVFVAAMSPQGKRDVGFTMQKVSPEQAGLSTSMSDLLEQVDPRLRHVGKWVMSVGDAVAVGDVDGDGRLDLFLTNALKSDGDRAAIYLNRSDASGLRFERFHVPALDALGPAFKTRGIAAGGSFVDWDGDGDDDLLVTVAFGRSMLLRNDRSETGVVGFTDVTTAMGIDEHTVSLGALFFDVENDGDLDLLILNATTPYLPGYEQPTPLNIFDLPAPTSPDDRRMFRFMHNG